MHVLLINGPNLNLLGTRNPEIYGSETLDDVVAAVTAEATALGHTVEAFQSNHEGAIIDRLHAARGTVDGIVMNPGAFTHTSYAIHDAIEAIEIPTVEVHISNVEEREPWRRESRVRAACVHTIYGRGTKGYLWALRHLHHRAMGTPITSAYGSHPDQYGDLRLPEGSGAHPVVVLLHGGFWRHQYTKDSLEGIACDLAAHGVATWLPEYRRIGKGGGAVPTGADVKAAVDHLTRLADDHPLDLDRVAVVGHSAGGQLALVAAPTAAVPLRLVASVGGVLDLETTIEQDLGDGVVLAFLDGEDPAPHSPISRVPIGVPTLVVHGTADDTIPVTQADDYVAAATAAGDRVIAMRLDGVDHMNPILVRSETWPLVRAALLDALA